MKFFVLGLNLLCEGGAEFKTRRSVVGGFLDLGTVGDLFETIQ